MICRFDTVSLVDIVQRLPCNTSKGSPPSDQVEFHRPACYHLQTVGEAFRDISAQKSAEYQVRALVLYLND